MKVNVIGLGYIGLPTAAVLASVGHEITGVDISPEIVSNLNNGRVHIVEPGLQELVSASVASGNLVASLVPTEADVFIITVPTPITNEDGVNIPDISFVKLAIKSITSVLKSGDLIIIESTCPIGTTNQISEYINDLCPNVKVSRGDDVADSVYLAFCPERVLPGKILRELVENHRIVGGLSERATELAIDFYKTFVTGNISSASSSEMAEATKLVENSFRDLNIAFANELSMMCDELSLDVWELRKLANCHPRVEILEPGPGVGGHCIAVDPHFLIHTAPFTSRLIQLSRKINDAKPEYVIKKVCSFANNNPEKNIICFGLTFKPDIDDIRESPSMYIYRQLREKYENRVYAVDPNLKGTLHTDINFLPDDFNYEKSSDIFVLLVNHKEFYELRPTTRTIVDTKGIW